MEGVFNRTGRIVVAKPLLLSLCLLSMWASRSAASAELSYQVQGDAIPLSLTGIAGDALKGRGIVANRQVGLCLLCHSGPVPEERFQGNLAPELAGAGDRWSAGQLRLRIVDASRLNPDTIMPAYYRSNGLTHVAPALQGKTLLDAQQVEDVVAYLCSLKDTQGKAENGRQP